MFSIRRSSLMNRKVRTRRRTFRAERVLIIIERSTETMQQSVIWSTWRVENRATLHLTPPVPKRSIAFAPSDGVCCPLSTVDYNCCLRSHLTACRLP